MKNSIDDFYTPENIPLDESIYGKNLISLGGLEAVDNMFSDINLKKLNILDIGFGLGGVAFYLAKKYQITISGIEIHPWMVKHAETHAPKDIAHLLKFANYTQSDEIPFESNWFDLVYSKGVLNHVKNKNNLFLKISKLLKPNSLFVIADWICPKVNIDKSSPLVNETQNSYQLVLEKTGFKEIKFRNDSMIFLGYVNKLLDNLIISRDFIENKYGSEIYSMIELDHQKLIADIKLKQKFAVRITAKKR